MLVEPEVHLRSLNINDWHALEPAMRAEAAQQGYEPLDPGRIPQLIESFPDGQLCIEIKGTPVGVAICAVTAYDKAVASKTSDDIFKNIGTSSSRDGDVLLGITAFVLPEHRGQRLGRRLYDARKELCESMNLRGILEGARIDPSDENATSIPPQQYIERVRRQEISDPVLAFQLNNGLSAKKPLKGSFSFLLEWTNIYYEAKPSLIGGRPSVIRIGLVQWQMRRVSGLEELISVAEYFVDSISGYRSDFIVFPEFFNAALMAPFNEQPTPTAIRSLASFTEPIIERFKEFAVSYNVNIIAGSMPLEIGNSLYNVSHLCRRDGTVEYQEKIHITPSEVASWGIRGGDQMKVFDTDSGRIAIQICYDVEFPELARQCARQGVELILVPFLTDTQNGYLRVRRCAQARAIENECFVAIAGSVGNLPKVHNMDVHYAQSAVFSPSDFAFPVDAIVSEATPNTEMTVIADVNLDLLKELHAEGSVRNLKDRRTDLYDLQWKGSTTTD